MTHYLTAYVHTPGSRGQDEAERILLSTVEGNLELSGDQVEGDELLRWCKYCLMKAFFQGETCLKHNATRLLQSAETMERRFPSQAGALNGR